MRISKVLTLVLALSLALALPAWSASAQEGKSGSVTTITLLHPHPGAYKAVLAEFAKVHPEIKVEEQSIPFNEMINQVQARLGSKDDTLDVLAVDPPRLANMVTNGFLDQVPKDNAALMKQVDTPVGVQSVTYKDVQYAYPIWTSDNLLFYNVDVLKKAGIAIPGATPAKRWTWEQVLDAAQKVKAAKAADYGFGIEQVDRYYALQPMIESFGGSPGLVGDGNLTPDVNSQNWIKFGEWYASLYTSGLSPRGIDASQMPELFANGKVALYLAGPTRIAQLQSSNMAGKWGISPHPYFQGKKIITPTDSWALGVSAFSKKMQAGHTFVKFVALTKVGATAMSSLFNLPPVNIEAYPAFIERMKGIAPGKLEQLDAILKEDNGKHARHRPSSVGYVAYEIIMNKSFSDIRNGFKVKEILDRSQADLTRALAQFK